MHLSSSTPLVIKSLLTRGVAEFDVHEGFSIDSFFSRFAIGLDDCVLERDDLGTVMYGFINVITMIACRQRWSADPVDPPHQLGALLDAIPKLEG